MSSFDKDASWQIEQLQKVTEQLRAAHSLAMDENKYLIGILNALPVGQQQQPPVGRLSGFSSHSRNSSPDAVDRQFHRDPSNKRLASTAPMDGLADVKFKQGWKFSYGADGKRESDAPNGRMRELEIKLTLANEQIAKHEKQEKATSTEHEHMTRVLKHKLQAAEKQAAASKEREDGLAAELRAAKRALLDMETKARREQLGGGGGRRTSVL